MTINNILDQKFNDFVNDELYIGTIAAYCNGSIAEGSKSFKVEVDRFFSQIYKKDHQKYLYRKLLVYLNDLEFNVQNKSGGRLIISEQDERSFDDEFSRIKNDVILNLENLGVDVLEETFTKQDLKVLIDKVEYIATKLDWLQKQNLAGQEVIYNSVYDIKEDLLDGVEEVSILGKSKTMQYFKGKVADMAFKLGVGKVLTLLPENYKEVENTIKELL